MKCTDLALRWQPIPTHLLVNINYIYLDEGSFRSNTSRRRSITFLFRDHDIIPAENVAGLANRPELAQTGALTLYWRHYLPRIPRIRPLFLLSLDVSGLMRDRSFWSPLVICFEGMI